VAEYLAIEKAAEFKSEFYDGEMFAMAGASRDHNRVRENLVGELFGRLRGGPCSSFSSDMRVRVNKTGLYTYPDMLIVCGVEEYPPGDPDTLLNPTVILEVLSPSTERYDRTIKFRHYKQIESLREYVLVSQDEPAIERRIRQPDGRWILVEVTDLDAEFVLDSVPLSVPMADIYRGVVFPPSRPLREPTQ
jgi:Uma2 family endonuclease